MNWKRFLVAIFAALLLLPSVSMAQSIVTGAVGGVVTDPSGSVIVGASCNFEDQRDRRASNDEHGLQRNLSVHAAEARHLRCLGNAKRV